MAPRPFDVVEVVTMQLVLSDATVLGVTAELGFRASDPYTVRAAFTGPHSMSTWLVGRELLAQGLESTQESPAGTGDVRVWRDADPTYVLISLSGVEGDALLAAPAAPVERFVATTQQLVPFGAESTRMDPEISRLIAALLTA